MLYQRGTRVLGSASERNFENDYTYNTAGLCECKIVSVKSKHTHTHMMQNKSALNLPMFYQIFSLNQFNAFTGIDVLCIVHGVSCHDSKSRFSRAMERKERERENLLKKQRNLNPNRRAKMLRCEFLFVKNFERENKVLVKYRSRQSIGCAAK